MGYPRFIVFWEVATGNKYRCKPKWKLLRKWAESPWLQFQSDFGSARRELRSLDFVDSCCLLFCQTLEVRSCLKSLTWQIAASGIGQTWLLTQHVMPRVEWMQDCEIAALGGRVLKMLQIKCAGVAIKSPGPTKRAMVIRFGMQYTMRIFLLGRWLPKQISGVYHAQRVLNDEIVEHVVWLVTTSMGLCASSNGWARLDKRTLHWQT